MPSDILAELLRLPTERRTRLAGELIGSLDGKSDPGAADAWDAKIERRGADVDAGGAETMSLDEYRPSAPDVGHASLKLRIRG